MDEIHAYWKAKGRSKYARKIAPRVPRAWVPLPTDPVEKRAAAYARANANKRSKPELNRIRSKRYYRKNAWKVKVKVANRNALRLSATPKWANMFFIREAYHLAGLREKVCGGKWHVDHIVPLKSDLVCGLHVHNNLRVIPGVENLKKGNRHWPDMPFDAVTGADHSESMRDSQ